MNNLTDVQYQFQVNRFFTSGLSFHFSRLRELHKIVRNHYYEKNLCSKKINVLNYIKIQVEEPHDSEWKVQWKIQLGTSTSNRPITSIENFSCAKTITSYMFFQQGPQTSRGLRHISIAGTFGFFWTIISSKHHYKLWTAYWKILVINK